MNNRDRQGRREDTKPRLPLPSLLLLLPWLFLRPASLAADAPADASAPFDRNVAATDARVLAEMADRTRFLWVDFLPDTRQRDVQARLGRGEIVLDALTTRDHAAEIPIPGGLVHHWVGTVFVPGAHVRDVVALMQDYDRHDKVFAPSIAASHLVSRNGDTFTFSMRFVIRKVITAVLQTDQEARFSSPASDRVYSRLRSTRIVEIDNAGTPQEKERPAERDRGYLWRQVSYWRYLERDGGTYMQCESISLSRPLPMAIGWLFNGAAAGVPRDTMLVTLTAARKELGRK